ncbi:MAG TPA: tetratricopeptide repeat protein [Candidatus Udaeobacter sp.]|nr:tetratricopeptide repeat protein [Candidatus Udaeobacter sp.]
MEKAIEIKRRAQRCIQNGDLDGALSEYEKLVAIEDSDPYNLVLLADLLFKKGATGEAGQRYLGAATAYEKAGLYKNAIAVCKKLMRLQLAPSQVFERLASLHLLDGLGTEASLYFQQHAENLAREEKYAEAAKALKQAYDASHENVKALERLAEVQLLLDKRDDAVKSLLEAAQEYGRASQMADADRCRKRARQLDPSAKIDALEAGETVDVTPETRGAPATLPTRATSEPASHAGHGPESADPKPARLQLDTAVAEESVEAGTGETERPGASRISDLELSRDMGSFVPPRLGADDHGSEIERTSIPNLNGERPAVEPLETHAPFETPVSAKSAGTGTEPGPPALEMTPVEASEAEAPAEVREEPMPLRSSPAKGAGSIDTVEKSGAASAAAAPPGLAFEGAESAAASGASLGEVERMLSRAQECFRAGQREAASEALAGAASAYDSLGRFDSAATIYRSLGKSAHATVEMLERWLENCERRKDRAEAAQVACELGDRALNEGHAPDARRWFERARDYDSTNDISLRRLQRMSSPGGADPPAPKPDAPAGRGSKAAPARESTGPAVAGAIEPGRVEVAVGRGEAVTFDLGSLISEFQRGVEAQLSGDARSHYDLAMSYREMGLLEQAVEAFRTASDDPECGVSALEMSGRCLREQGRFEEAVEEFGRALSRPGLDATARLGLHYELGMAHQGAGELEAAIAEFEIVHGERPDFADVAERLAEMRRKPGKT